MRCNVNATHCKNLPTYSRCKLESSLTIFYVVFAEPNDTSATIYLFILSSEEKNVFFKRTETLIWVIQLFALIEKIHLSN